jgi:predicted dehydrogenase
MTGDAIAVVGAGRWGPNLVRNLLEIAGDRMALVVDPDAGRRRVVAETFGVATAADVADALDDPDIGAVALATPTETHVALARRALNAGKHVLVEKPLSTSRADGEALCRLAEEWGLVLMVGHVFLYDAAVQEVHQRLAAGDLGRLLYISMTRTNLGPVREVSAAWDLASHDVAIVNHWLGGLPRAVSASGVSWLRPGVEDAVFATLRYPNDVLIHLRASWLEPCKTRAIAVVGEERMATIDHLDPDPLRMHEHDGTTTSVAVAEAEPLRVQCQDFLDCISSGKEPAASGSFGLGVVRVLDALHASMASGGHERRIG